MQSDTIGSTIQVSGMFKCCVATIQADPGPNEEGKVLECRDVKKCGARVKFTGGKWYWWPR
jgi:hypothetical protein